jgi:hypothetical protein
MSSIACFYRVPRSSLGAGEVTTELLARADDLGDGYGWSGYVMLNLLIALEEAGANLGADLPEVTQPDGEAVPVFLVTPADLGMIDGLDLNRLDDETLSMGLGLDEEELREAVGDSVTTLRELLVGTQSHEVLVIRIC